MAREVIADLDFNEASAREAIRVLQERIASLEGQTRRTADVFTARMFNMRQAALALLGGFTIGGGILAFKNFLEQVIKSAGAFSTFQEHLGRTETALSKILVDLLSINPLLEALTRWVDRLNVLLESVGANAESGGKIIRWLFGQTDVGTLLRLIESMGALIDKASGRKAVLDFIGPPAAPGIGNEPRFAPDLDKFLEKAKNFNIEAMTHGLFVAKEMAKGVGENLNFVNEQIEEITINQYSLATAIDLSAEKFELLSVAAQAAGAAIGNALFTAGTTAKQALAAILKQITVIALTQSFMHLAAAYASTTLIGAAATGGTPAQHKAAAAFWGKVAAFAAAGALLAGGRQAPGG
ncbi:MAG TPA: hypothetical protein VKD72_12485, partial [Gemmataceae bacterium]|nr:hypothetical protein [Gemmataceae bacterium]